MKEIIYKNCKDYMLFKVKKNYDYNILFSVIPEIKIKLLENHKTRAIIDIRSITTEIPLADRREMAKLVTLLFDPSYKLAVLNSRRNNIKVAEQTARSAGINMFVTYDIKKIKEWFK